MGVGYALTLKLFVFRVTIILFINPLCDKMDKLLSCQYSGGMTLACKSYGKLNK